MQPRWLFRAHRLFWCALGFIALTPSVSASEYSLTGPLDFVRERGRPQREVIHFEAPAPGKYYLLRIHNGPGEQRPVDAGWITVNGKKTVNLASLHWQPYRKKDFDCPFWKPHCSDWQNGEPEPVEIPLSLELANELAVQLHGRPGGGLRLEVLSVGDENPYFNEFPLSGPHTLTPVFGWPQEQEIAFDAPVAGAHYLLRLRNGAGELMPVSAGWLWLNGRELLGPKDFAWNNIFCRKGHSWGKATGHNQHAPWRPDFGQPCDEDPEIQLPLSLALENTLTVKLHGHWHSGVEVEIVGVDNDLPLISAAVDPAANEAGWHKVDATVSFTCSDGLSGIESCSDPVLVSEEGADQAIAGTAVDKAGNTAETQLSVSLDKTAPLLTAEITPPANDAGWHRETATIAYQCEDTLSGVANCPEQQQVSEEGADQQVSASATDIAGNSTPIQNTVSLDLTPPEIVTGIHPPANSAGWHKSPVALSYQCSDNLSGVAECPEERIESLQGHNREILVTATDIAGNSADSSARLSIDTTPPAILPQLSVPANAAGWHRAPVTVSYLCNDNLSGIVSCPQPQTLAGDGAGQAVRGSALDLAGNSASAGITVNLDQAPPQLSAEIAPPANSAGWHRETVTIRYQCDDTLSGVANCPEQQQVIEEGVDQQITATAEDIAGNSTQIENTVNLDLTPPEIATTINPPANSAGWHKAAVTLSYQCSDTLSGVAECPEDRIESQEGRDQEIPVSAADIAGNSASSRSLLNIDTTAPAIQPQLSAPANAHGWHKAPVTVSYQCSDNLSGIATCPQPQTLAGDGADQTVNGSALDLAGNSASAEITVNLDQTPPEISFISPANGALLREPQPELQLLLSDNLALDADSLEVIAAGSAVTGCVISGNRARCVLPQPLPADAEIALSASVRDLAGNTGEAGITTAIDSDGDAVADYADQCADTASTHTANANGCSLEQLDSDNDGVNDAEEIAAGSDPQDSNSFPPLVIETFVASPSTIGSKGQRVELRWQVKGAREIAVSSDGGEATAEALASEGALAVNPRITTNYTLTATGPGGEASQSLTVKLDLPPPPDLWTAPSIPVQEQIATSLAVAEDGSAYVGAFDGYFYKVSPSGQVEWTLENAGLVMGKAAIAGERIIVGANVSGSGRLESAGRVYALDSDKTLLWDFDTEGAVVAGPLLSADKGIAYIATYIGHIYALDTQSGERRWHYQLPEGKKITAAPALSGQRLIVHTENKQIFALDASESPARERILWSRNLE